LESGEITAYYVIPADFVESGEFFYVYPDTTPLVADGQAWLMSRALMVNLLGGDIKLADRVWSPMSLYTSTLSPAPQSSAQTGKSKSLVRYFPAVMAVLFYIFMLTAANMLLRSVSSEKENRTIEVLMQSITPPQLLAGKIAGLGIASLVQTVAWVGTLFAVMTMGGKTINLPSDFNFPVSLLAWGLVYFVLGFAIYASLMAGVGALVPKLKEANQASFVAMTPLIIGYMIGLLAPLAEATNEALPTLFSLFPLTAPIVMMMRLTAGFVPLWQLLLAAGLMATTAYSIIRAVAAMFHTQHLLSRQSFSVKLLLRAFLGRNTPGGPKRKANKPGSLDARC
jgi:ABC-2 type transport system permease protein